MKIFIISPNVDTFLSKDHLEAVRGGGEVVTVQAIRPLSEVSELYEGDEPRIVAIDPDYCEWKFPNEVIERIPNLKAICLQTTSFSWVDLDFTAERGIPVTNLRGFSSIAVAEWATMMTLALARRLPVIIKDDWKQDYTAHRGQELRGKTAGVIGLGRIGTAIAKNMAGLGMDVQYWSKSSRNEAFRFVELAELLKTSDVVLTATAMNDETKTLLDDIMIASMKPTAILVSIADPIYNHDAVLDMVKNERLYGYGFEDEQNAFGAYQGNVWNGPALAWCTNESISKNAELWVESIVAASKGEFPNRVND